MGGTRDYRKVLVLLGQQEFPEVRGGGSQGEWEGVVYLRSSLHAGLDGLTLGSLYLLQLGAVTKGLVKSCNLTG